MNARRAAAIGSPVLVLAALGGGVAYLDRMRPTLELGVGYGARVACACRHVGNRPLAQCYADFEPGMEPIRLIEDVGARSVTAYVPGVASRTARFDPLLGCQPDPLGN